MLRTPRNLVPLGLATAVALAAAPGTASAQNADVRTAARLEAGANLDTERAAGVAYRSAGRARRFLSRSRTSLERAYRVTLAAQGGESASAVAASTTFTAALGRNDIALERLIDRSSGPLLAAATRALDRNVAMRGQITLGLAAGANGGDADVATAVGSMAEQHGDVTAGLATRLSTTPGPARLRSALCTTLRRALLDAQRISDALVRLHAAAEGETRATVADAATSLAESMQFVASMLATYGSGSMSAGGSGDVGGLSVSVTAQAQVNAQRIRSAS
jgi:hypothetical protein